jgi:hypothetical protein
VVFGVLTEAERINGVSHFYFRRVAILSLWDAKGREELPHI